ncbi:Charged multivesicular body protein 2b [Porphyridium purpureum]|uniref:Charged multivesicular body protein 2b n=1 Tax=Porphyridium purpureum TaxID=35688 RepID=A0A5J4Z3I0_PORPP|nr:Charged multivesicular body protein 2b [Porphyridium purpureum]|eukprot:POR6614..scf295_1
MPFGYSRNKAAPQAPPPVSAAPSAQPVARTTKDVVRTEHRNVEKAVRDLDREMLALQREEKKMEREIKELAAKGQNDHARILARSLVQNRNQQKQMKAQQYQLGGMKHNMSNAATQQTMAGVLGSANKAMAEVNGAVDTQGAMKNIMQYDKETEKMKMQQEMMNDVMNDAMGGEELDAETEDILAQVLDETALSAGQRMNTGPGVYARPQDPRAQSSKSGAQVDAEVEQMMAALRR